jgi:cystathionine beta-lyase
MTHAFDEEPDRRGTDSLKWEFVQNETDPERWERTDRFLGEDRVLPMWVADMDFRCPEPVIRAVIARAEQGVYGYTMPGDDLYAAVANWMRRRHGWEIDPEWICLTSGVVTALNMIVRAFASAGDEVLIQPPVYYPFFSAIQNNGAGVAASPLILESGRYRMDFADLEAKARDPRVKIAILCSPHNPVGRVWSREELRRFGEICLRHNVLIVSDEIHGDLIFRGSAFTPFASISPDFAAHSITCTAPSKTFNLAGLKTSAIIIPDANVRKTFHEVLRNSGLSLAGSTFGVVALKAAYEQGEPWLEQTLNYLQGNLDYLESYVGERIPQIEVVSPEGTYLVWLDCRKLGLDKSGLKHLMREQARVYLDEGDLFGPEGEGFERINIACPRSTLVEALDRIRKAVQACVD